MIASLIPELMLLMFSDDSNLYLPKDKIQMDVAKNFDIPLLIRNGNEKRFRRSKWDTIHGNDVMYDHKIEKENQQKAEEFCKLFGFERVVDYFVGEFTGVDWMIDSKKQLHRPRSHNSFTIEAVKDYSGESKSGYTEIVTDIVMDPDFFFSLQCEGYQNNVSLKILPIAPSQQECSGIDLH